MAGRASTPVPDGWREIRLGDAIVPTGVRRRPGEVEPEILSCSKDYGVIPQNQLFGKRLASADTSRYKLVYPGDFVYDPNLLWSGAIARSSLTIAGLVSPVYEVFKAAEATDARFLAAWLKSPARLSEYQRVSVGTNVRRRRASIEDLASLSIVLPPLPEQRAIAAVLDSIDEAKDRTEEVIAATERLRDAILHNLLTGGLPGHHTAWRDVPGLGTIPASWEVARLGDHATVKNGTTPSRSKATYWQDGTVPFVKTGRVNDVWIREPDEFITKQGVDSGGAVVVPAGSVLIAMIGQGKTRGMAASLLFDAAINQNFAAIYGASNQLLLEFVLAWARSNYSHIRNAGQGTNQDALNCQLIEGLRLPLPPLDEQRAIVATLDSVDAAIEGARAERAALQSSKASTADALLTGRVRAPLLKG
ncbi:MAG: hypothetical protein F4Y50_13780 [Dehalococcoidia bacterium]|nr:hypothetical protein [Dehalococcoidia bacterium]